MAWGVSVIPVDLKDATPARPRRCALRRRSKWDPPPPATPTARPGCALPWRRQP